MAPAGGSGGDQAAYRRTEPAAPLKALVATAVEPGTRLGCYLVMEKLGEGGMGVVYKAQDTSLGRIVALKILPPHLFHNPTFLQRFRTEAQAQARLNSSNVVTLFSLLEVPAGLVLVMEYVEGETLEQHIHSDGPLSIEEALTVFDQALRGVEHAHSVGIVHRDLKPNNIFLTRNGEIKLMDFGIARIIDASDPELGSAMLGTLLYISPEQITGRVADFRSDIYTLGISLFEAVTGRLPFERKSDYSLMHAHILERPPTPRKFQRKLPHEIESVILKAIEKDPDKRFQTATAFREALQKQAGRVITRGGASPLQDPAPTAGPMTGIADRRDRIFGGLALDLALLAAVAALALALGLIPIHFHPIPTKPPTVTTPLVPESSSAAQPAAAPVTPAVRQPPQIVAPDTTNGGVPLTAPDASPRTTLPRKYKVLRRVWGRN